jgi:hypothetical protein
MPWLPELFSAPALEQLQEKRRLERLATVPFFDGMLMGEPAALTNSFADEPELHHPVRGRIKGARAFEAYVAEMNAWFRERNASVEDVQTVGLGRHGFDEVIIHVDGESGRVDIPVATVADKRSDRRIEELRMYYSSWALTGRHATRPPVLQPDPELREPDAVAEYLRALAAGDVDAIVAAFEPDGYIREAAGTEPIHRAPDGLRAFYASLLGNDGGIVVEPCALVGNERTCALEYNVVRWGNADLPPQAGVAVYVHGDNGKLAAVRVYDDAEPRR